MFITDLIQVGQIYLEMLKHWKLADARITVKNEEEMPFNNVLIDSREKTDEIYKYLLKNWGNKKLQIFWMEDPVSISSPSSLTP